MAETQALKVRGWFSNPNSLSGRPDGALAVAKNVSLARPGSVQPKRGFEQDGYVISHDLGAQDVYSACRSMASGVRLCVAKDQSDRQWRVFADVGFELDATTQTWGDFSADTDDVEQSGARVAADQGPLSEDLARQRFLDAGGQTYVSTKSGLLRVSIPETNKIQTYRTGGATWGSILALSQAGIPRAQDIQSALLSLQTGGVDNYGTGYLEADSASAYRAVWVLILPDGRELVSSPSGRSVAINRTYTASVSRVGGSGTKTTVTLASGTFEGGAPPTGIVFNMDSVATGLVDGPRTGDATAPTTSVITTTVALTGDAAGSGGGGSVPSTTGNTVDFGTRPVTVTVNVPKWVTVNHILRVFRSPLAASWDSEPSDEMRQVYETTGVDGSSTHSTSFVDATPDSLRGAPLYTSPSQEGPLQANDQPPVASDFAEFKGYAFAANTYQKHRRILTLLSVGGTNGVQNNDVVYVGELKYTFKTTATTEDHVQIYNNANKSQEQNVADTARSFCKTINSDTRNVHLSAFYVAGPNDFPGTILIEQTSPGVVLDSLHVYSEYGFAVVQGQARPLAWNPPLEVSSELSAGADGWTRVDGYTTLDVGGTFPLGSDNGKSIGWFIQVIRKTTSSVRGGLKKILSETPPAFGSSPQYPTFYDPGSDTTEASAAGPKYILVKAGASDGDSPSGSCMSSRESAANRLHRSKFNEYESWPSQDWYQAGSQTAGISRIVATRDSLFILKDDGVYRLTGEDETSFRVEPFDTTVRLVAPETACTFQNEVWFLSDQGVVSVSDSGVTLRSDPVNDVILAMLGDSTGGNYDGTILEETARAAWACGYESEGAFFIGMLTDSVNDPYPTRILVYYAAAQGWADWDDAASFGFVDRLTNKLTLCPHVGGDVTPGRTNRLFVERKTMTPDDFAGESRTVSAVGNGSLISIPDATEFSYLSVGDVVRFGSASGVVTAVFPMTKLISISLSADWEGVLTVYKAFTSIVQWQADVGNSPAVLKKFYDVIVHARYPWFSKARLGFATDSGIDNHGWNNVDGTIFSTIEISGPNPYANDRSSNLLANNQAPMYEREFRCPVPRRARRGTRLHVRWTSVNALNGWLIDGLTLKYEPGGPMSAGRSSASGNV